jgi:membrane glycosyltransferase
MKSSTYVEIKKGLLILLVYLFLMLSLGMMTQITGFI